MHTNIIYIYVYIYSSVGAICIIYTFVGNIQRSTRLLLLLCFSLSRRGPAPLVPLTDVGWSGKGGKLTIQAIVGNFPLDPTYPRSVFIFVYDVHVFVQHSVHS